MNNLNIILETAIKMKGSELGKIKPPDPIKLEEDALVIIN